MWRNFLKIIDHYLLQIQNLKAKKERFPNEYDLIKAFLKEAAKENQKEPVKKALLKLAVKVGGYNLVFVMVYNRIYRFIPISMSI